MTVGDFPQTIARLHFKLMWFSQNSSALQRSIHRRGINGRDLFSLESLSKSTDLVASFVGELNIRRAGESVLGRQDRRAVSNEKDSNVHDDKYFILSKKRTLTESHFLVRPHGPAQCVF
jgi:hypothetical protein